MAVRSHSILTAAAPKPAGLSTLVSSTSIHGRNCHGSCRHRRILPADPGASEARPPRLPGASILRYSSTPPLLLLLAALFAVTVLRAVCVNVLFGYSLRWEPPVVTPPVVRPLPALLANWTAGRALEIPQASGSMAAVGAQAFFIPLYELFLTYGGIFRLNFGPKVMHSTYELL